MRLGWCAILFVCAACDGTLGGDSMDGGTRRTDAGMPALDAGVPSLDAGMPIVDAGVDPCTPVPGDGFTRFPHGSTPTDRPAAEHPDINLAIRGWSPTGGALGLVDYGGDTDLLAPKLHTMFAPDRVPTFTSNHQVSQWDWATGTRAGAITDPEVTLSGFGTTPGEVLELPEGGYEIGLGMEAMVLFVTDDMITLKYTAEDSVAYGYAIHMVGVCVDPRLRALYDELNAAGRTELPALRGSQPFARARGTEVLVAIRDTGAFMDPRSRKDWW